MAIAQEQIQPPGSEDQHQEESHKVLFKYKSRHCPPQYACDDCEASGVRLWKNFVTEGKELKLTCKKCTEHSTGETVAKPGEVKSRIPAIPIQVKDNGALAFGYYFDVLEVGWAWWHGLKEEPETA